MSAKKKVQNRSALNCIVMGTVAGVILSIILSIVLALLISSARISEDLMSFGTIAILFLSTVIGCTVAAKLSKGKIAVQCAITAAVYFLILVAVNIVFFDVQFVELGSKVLSVILGAIIGCVLSGLSGKKRHHR